LSFKLCEKRRNIPFVGGLALFLSFFLTFLFFSKVYLIEIPFQLKWLFLFCWVFFLVEFFDDIYDFSITVKLVSQLIIIGIFLTKAKIIQIYFLSLWLNYFISFFWLMGITCAFNHLDISDGLCGGVSLITTLYFLIAVALKTDVGLLILFMALFGAIFSFLLLNFPPAKIFLGNSGSHFLGFFFGAMSMYIDYATLRNSYFLAFPLFILAYPMIDTFFIIFVRLKKRIMPLMKSNDHIFLRLLSSGWSERKALLRIFLLTLLWGMCGVFLYFGMNIFFVIFSLFVFLMTGKIIIYALRAER